MHETQLEAQAQQHFGGGADIEISFGDSSADVASEPRLEAAPDFFPDPDAVEGGGKWRGTPPTIAVRAHYKAKPEGGGGRGGPR
uniref:hypothetical protein n=1 Tax=Methylosinus sp. RM1 TaxID=2583817 RepID=UPI001A9C8F0C